MLGRTARTPGSRPAAGRHSSSSSSSSTCCSRLCLTCRRHTHLAATGDDGTSSTSSSSSSSTTTSSSSSSSSTPATAAAAATAPQPYYGRPPNGRRAALGTLAGLGIALGGNLGGITSFLLGLDEGQLAGRLKLDVLVPVQGFKRCIDYANGYEFRYPAAWLGDQTLAARTAAREEAARGMMGSLPSLSRPRRRSVVEPTAAFGPAGSTGEKNVSVIVAPLMEGFTLEAFGTPAELAQRFLDTSAAPPGSDKTAALLAASSRQDDSGVLYYQFEFTVSSSSFSRHNVSVLAAADNRLFTLNCQCPQPEWERESAQLLATAASFRLLPETVAARGFPERL